MLPVLLTRTPGKWATVENNTLGADQSFIYSCELQFDSVKRKAGGTMLGLQFYLFSNTTEVNLGGDTPVKFNVSPAFAKFTVRLTDWVWQSADDPDERAEVRVAITPAFTGFFEVAGDEADFVREFALTGQQSTYSGGASTRVRLVEAVELDGKLVTAKEAGSNGRKAVEFTLEANSSSLVVSFARFNTSAVFDPGTPFPSLLPGELRVMGAMLTMWRRTRSGGAVDWAERRWRRQQRQHRSDHRSGGGGAVGRALGARGHRVGRGHHLLAQAKPIEHRRSQLSQLYRR